MTKSQKTLVWVGAGLAAALGLLWFTRRAKADGILPGAGGPDGEFPDANVPVTTPPPGQPGGPQLGKDPLPLHTHIYANRLTAGGKLASWFKGEGGVWLPNNSQYGEYSSAGAIARNHPILQIVGPGEVLYYANSMWTPDATAAFGYPQYMPVAGMP